MGYLNPLVLDNGLSVLTANGNRLDICRAEPATFAEATVAFSLGNKTPIVIAAPSALSSPVGRRVAVPAISDGSVTGTSTGLTDDAEFWAITDTVNSRLLAAGSLSAATLVVAGDSFILNSFDIGLPFPA